MFANFSIAVFWRVFSAAAALFAGLGSLKLFSKHLEPESYGVVVVALQILGYIPYLAGGYRTATNRRILADPDAAEKQRLIRFCQTFYTWMAGAMLLASALAMYGYTFTPAARAGDEPVIFFLALGGAATLTFIGSVQVGLLVGLRAQSVMFATAGFSSLVNYLALWFCLREGLDVWSFPVAALATAALNWLIAVIFIRQKVPGIRFFALKTDAEFWESFRALRTDAMNSFRSQVAIVLLFSLDIILVGMISSLADAAAYGVLTRFFTIIRSFLQSAGESAWPIIAERGVGNHRFTNPLLTLNAWIYGALCGGLFVALVPVVHWYMGDKWTLPNWVVAMMVARTLIIGVSSPTSFFLVGLGKFKVLSRLVEREWITAFLLALLLGGFYGLDGIAGAFLIATVAGTLWPIFAAYARETGLNPLTYFAQLWLRAGIACGVSALVAQWTLATFTIPAVGLAACAAGGLSGVFAGLLWAAARWLPQRQQLTGATRRERIIRALQLF